MESAADSRARETAERLTSVTRMFLALGIEADKERLSAWIEATHGLNTAQLELGARKLMREWRKGTPRPADLIAAVRERAAGEQIQESNAPSGPWVRLDDMARAMGLDHLSQLADPEMTQEERELCCERYEQAMARGEVRLYPVLPGAGERYR